jgi:hypothetical protein
VRGREDRDRLTAERAVALVYYARAPVARRDHRVSAAKPRELFSLAPDGDHVWNLVGVLHDIQERHRRHLRVAQKRILFRLQTEQHRPVLHQRDPAVVPWIDSYDQHPSRKDYVVSNLKAQKMP